MKNRRFGKLLVKYGTERCLECHCDCGKWVRTTAKWLLTGKRTACNTCQPLRVFHGPKMLERKTRLGKSYISARHHCTYKGSVNWPHYGGRGIQFRFKNFEEWAQELGPCPKGYFLDRIDPEGHYEKGNVRWVPRWVSTHNRRKYIKSDLSQKSHSNFRGVWKSGTGWAALVQYQGKRFYLGTFSNEIDAAKAYNEKAHKLFGQYYAPNLITNLVTSNQIV